MKRRLFSWMILPLLMVGCGQSGPLYLPGPAQTPPPPITSVN